MDTLVVLFNRAIALLSQIGNLFGRVTGIRIGGPALTGIIALLAAKFVAGRVPSLFKWALIIGGVILLAGSGANILQTIMRYLPG